MQRLGKACGLLRCSEVYGNGVVGFVPPVSKRGHERSRCRGGVLCMQRRSREEEEQSTATSSSVVDLPGALASSDGGFASAARWRGLVSETEWRGEE
jgi:hypothetical protein